MPLAEHEIPVLDCASLVVFKALFNRTKDWADIEAVAERSPGHIDQAAQMVAGLLGPDAPILRKLDSLRR